MKWHPECMRLWFHVNLHWEVKQATIFLMLHKNSYMEWYGETKRKIFYCAIHWYVDYRFSYISDTILVLREQLFGGMSQSVHSLPLSQWHLAPAVLRSIGAQVWNTVYVLVAVCLLYKHTIEGRIIHNVPLPYGILLNIAQQQSHEFKSFEIYGKHNISKYYNMNSSKTKKKCVTCFFTLEIKGSEFHECRVEANKQCCYRFFPFGMKTDLITEQLDIGSCYSISLFFPQETHWDRFDVNFTLKYKDKDFKCTR